jgi:hypothetical protein
MDSLVYTLSDPRTGAIRYVGQTSRTLRCRLTEHIQDVKRSRRYSSNWIKSLGGLEPVIELVEICATQEDADEAEAFYIEYFRFLGFSLTNLTGGGKGTVKDVVVTEKMRELARTKNLGKKLSPETRAKISAARSGTKMPARSAETRAKMGAIHRGKNVSEETRLRLSMARGGRPVVHVASGQRYETASDAARALGLLPQGVSQVARGRIKHTGGHVFKFVEVG